MRVLRRTAKKTVSTAFFTAIFYDARPDILFRATVTRMSVLEYDVISVVHVSGNAGNHFSVLFCNLHRVKHSTLVFSDEVLQVRIDRHFLVICKGYVDRLQEELMK